ncbi:MAG: 2'-5' RNA ligase family protein [Caldilineaceae bacterium]|nr:2'-5' RNA ligase family protein [Caldilineaceae bacterium]
MADQPTYSLQIMLPDDLNRRFARWAANTSGASWPGWGGHMTLLAPFTCVLSRGQLEAELVNAAAGHSPVPVSLTQLTVVPDWTRPVYWAVFLTPPAEGGSGLQRLRALHADIDMRLAPVRTDSFPDISKREYLPHITLALGLYEEEAHKMAGAARADKLIAKFMVDHFVLRQNGGTSEPSSASVIPLSGSPLP